MRFREKEINKAPLLFSHIYEVIFQAVTDEAVLPPQREDTDKIGEMIYFPPNGTFNLMYYPYYGKKAQVRLYLKSKYSIQDIKDCC